MSNAKTDHAVPKSHVLFRQAFKSPCWEESGIKQTGWREEVGRKARAQLWKSARKQA